MCARKKVNEKEVTLPVISTVMDELDVLLSSNLKAHSNAAEFAELRKKWTGLKKGLAQVTAHEEMLLDTARYLTSNLEEKEILTRIATGAMRVLHADESDIYLLSEDGKLLNPVVAIGPQYIEEILGTPLRVDASLTGKAVRLRHSQIVNDIRTETDAYQIPGTPVDNEERLIIVPLSDEDEVIGALCVTRLGAFFSNEDLKLAEAYAAFASSVLVNVRTHTELEAEVAERGKAENALRESEKKYRELTDFLPQIIFETDLSGKLTFMNRYAFTSMGYTYEDFENGLNAFDTVDPTDRERAVQNIGREINSDSYPAQEFRMIRKDGTRFHAIVLASPILRKKQAIGFRGVIIDINARKNAEEALRQSEESYHGLFNSVDEAIYIQDKEGKFLDANDGAEKMYGYTRNEMIGQTPEFVTAPNKNDLKRVFAQVQKAYRGEPQQFEFWGKRKNGEVFLKEVRLYPGNYYGMKVVIALANDITERRMAENAVKESEARYRQLVELSPDAIVIHVDQKFVYVNAAGIKMLGAPSSKEIIGKSVLSIVAPDYLDLVKSRLKMGEKTHSYMPPIVEKFIRFDGSLIDAEVVSIPITYNGLPAWQVVAHDISEQVQAQLKVTHASQELVKAYEATLEGWSHALEMRERETAGHSRRVADITIALAKRMNVPQDDLIQIRRGAILHDIGKLSIPDRILLKPDPLTKEEWVIMRQHPVFAYELLSPIAYLEPALEIPCNHHEHWDGSGYPHGLKGDEIPLSARIFAVVDEWDALTSDRPYRRAWTREAARQYLRDQRGKTFDPDIVDEFLKLMGRTEEFKKLGGSQ